MKKTNFLRNISLLSIIVVILLPLFTYFYLYPSFANVLIETFRVTDIIARFGGDEFAVFGVTVPDLNIELLEDRLKKNVTLNNEKADEPLTDISLSYGFAISDPGNPNSIDGLLTKADVFMYEVKQKKK